MRTTNRTIGLDYCGVYAVHLGRVSEKVVGDVFPDFLGVCFAFCVIFKALGKLSLLS